MTTTTGLGGGGHDGRRAHRFTSGLRRTPFSAGLMSTLQPVSLAARRAFWPFRPITKESWSLGTRTCAVSVSLSMTTATTVAARGVQVFVHYDGKGRIR